MKRDSHLESVANAADALHKKVRDVLSANPKFWGSVKLDIVIQDGAVKHINETLVTAGKIS